jgi:ABC-type nickel/cobalt efflux system permease component RcnA
MSIIAPLKGIIGFGLSHGINPSHGWPVALLYAIHSRRALLSSIVSSSITAGAHFMSSITVVVAYIIAINSLEVQIPEVCNFSISCVNRHNGNFSENLSTLSIQNDSL